MKRPEEVFDMMLDQSVGAFFAKTYSKIADYYENELLDYRKADKVFRMGLQKLESLDESDSKEARSLESLYERFCDRMLRRVEKEAIEEIQKVRKSQKVRHREEALRVQKLHEKVYGNQRNSFTKN